MRRNVRRLNREIGNTAASLPASTQASLPLALPTSYQPRSQEKKTLVDTVKTDKGHSETDSSATSSSLPLEDPSQLASQNGGDRLNSTNFMNNNNLKQEQKPKKKNVRKAANLSGKFIFLIIFSFSFFFICF